MRDKIKLLVDLNKLVIEDMEDFNKRLKTIGFWYLWCLAGVRNAMLMHQESAL